MKYLSHPYLSGCFTLTTTDPTLPNKLNSFTRAGRVCGIRSAGQVNIDETALRSIGMLHEGGDRKPLLSYIKKSDGVTLEYYQGGHLNGPSSRHTGVLTHARFAGTNTYIRDNVRSMMFMSTAYNVPTYCEMGKHEKPEAVSDSLSSIGGKKDFFDH